MLCYRWGMVTSLGSLSKHPYLLARGGARVSGSAEEAELRQKLEALATKRYGDSSAASLKQLFLSYDGNGDGALQKGELTRLLADANIGNSLTRSFWVDGIFKELDKSPNDGGISWDEYLAVANKGEEPPPAAEPPPPAAEEPPPAPLTRTQRYATFTVRQGVATPVAQATPVEPKSGGNTLLYAGLGAAIIVGVMMMK